MLAVTYTATLGRRNPRSVEVVPPDIDQFWHLLDLARDHRLHTFMVLAGNSGLRRGHPAPAAP
ncbi:MAG TPA: hypothetical protein VF062_27610 [Candidatus Limnocylindrales bacterium]